MSLMREILNMPIKPDELAVCFLGQNGFIFRSHDVALGVDLYLSNSCAEDKSITEALGMRLDRALPIFIPPSELELNLILATHEHRDHADPDTLLGVQTEGTKFAGPWPVLKLLSDSGFPKNRCVDLTEGQSTTVGSVTISAVFARHVPGSVGYLLEISGLKLYVTGDSEFDERLFAVAQFRPDLMFVCINGKWGNMKSDEAVELARRIAPKVVVPTHYDMFVANSADPNAFANSLCETKCGSRPLILKPGEIVLLSRANL